MLALSYLTASFLQHLCISHSPVHVLEDTDLACDWHRQLLVGQLHYEGVKQISNVTGVIHCVNLILLP